ncbi:hypothetical protein F5Y09DRAFT_301120 [Xylaria sp. FL1042]|nr:hypothetical protein F5Y09DRAFT_301120 [Xylaria sp. FL1042]
MQSLWSRAAQAQSSCRCRICLRSTNVLLRRSTTAAPRRRVTVADLFTACYTTILGTAAIIDARHKNERRRELDGQLDRARASLKQLDICDHLDPADGKNGASHGALPSPAEVPACWEPGRGDESIRPLLQELKSICDATYRPLARDTWIRGRIAWVNVEAGVAAEEFDREFSLREPLTYDHMADTTATVLELVDELLRQTRKYPGRRAQDEVQTSNLTEERLTKELEDLRRGPDFPSYEFPTADPSYSARIRAKLHKSIRRIFHQAVSTQETVARICWNLLTAGVPPTIHTYNNLIVGFNMMQRPDLAQVVINSFLDNTMWPATNQTVICLLSHYRRASGREGIREVVQRMRGVREDGLHLALLGSNDAHLPWNGKIVKAKRTDLIFDHLIRGWLYHEEVGIACMTFISCLRNGASLPVYTLHELLRCCLATADFANARKLLVGIVKNFENFKTYLSWIIENNTKAIVRKLLQGLYQIINICWLPFGEIFGETYKTYATAKTSFEAIISYLDAHLEVQEAPPRSSPLSPSAPIPPEPKMSYLELVLSSGDLSKLSKRTSTESERNYSRIAMLVSIERRLCDLEERVQNLGAAFKAAIIGIETGYEIDVSPLLATNVIGSGVFEDRCFATRRALSQLDLSHDSLTIEDIASQLFRRIPNQELIRPLEENGNWERLSIPTLISFFGSNAVSPPPDQEEDFGPSYRELEQQFRDAELSTKALIFAHLTKNTQIRIMYRHGHYNKIRTRGLRSFLHTDLKYNLPAVLHTTFPIQYNEFSDTYDAPVSLPRLAREEPAFLNHVTPSDANSSTPNRKEGPEESWGTVYQHEEQDPLEAFRQQSLRLQNAQLG